MKASEIIRRYGDFDIDLNVLEELLSNNVWKPKVGDTYYYINKDGKIVEAVFENTIQENKLIISKNYYFSAKLAEKALEMHKFCAKKSITLSKRDANSIVYYIVLDELENKAIIVHDIGYIGMYVPYCFASRKAALDVINRYSFKELLEYYGRVK